VTSECPIKNWEAIEVRFKQMPTDHDKLNKKLHSLYREVIRRHGKLSVKPVYMPEHDCHYIQISIEMKKEDIIG
ncbi:MAG: hypothetical protein FWG67_00280, partial [Defluviitaleaceae bacterium]|nr:hypothetical protein [Defluviitaleaceae bacterium]